MEMKIWQGKLSLMGLNDRHKKEQFKFTLDVVG